MHSLARMRNPDYSIWQPNQRLKNKFYPEGPSAFMPVQRIFSRFASAEVDVEGQKQVVMEDQRSEISCKRNIKATRPSMERLVYHGLLSMLFSYKFIPNQNLLYGKILPEKKSTVLVESSFIRERTLR